jgi:hypothetical protein
MKVMRKHAAVLMTLLAFVFIISVLVASLR